MFGKQNLKEEYKVTKVQNKKPLGKFLSLIIHKVVNIMKFFTDAYI